MMRWLRATDRRGIALPLVLGAVLCLAVWIGSLSWTQSQSRHRFTKTIKIRRAYFMARSALQLFFLKVKTMQRQCPNVMRTLYQARPEQWTVLSQSFCQDIVNPCATDGTYSGNFRIGSFTIESQDTENGEMSIQILADGTVEGADESIKRVYKVTR